ncbi:MAG: glycosyltransferase [Cyanobacteriota bacterium]
MKKNKNIFIGLSEVAGFGAMYAKGLKNLGYNVNFIISKPDLVNRDYPFDRCLDIQKYPKIFRLVILTFELVKSIIKYDYFIFLYGKSFWPGNYDLPVLKIFRKKIIAIFLGCEIRQRETILNLNRTYTPCQDCTNDCSFKIKKHIASMFEKYADKLFCQPEYDQLLENKDYEYAWVPIDIDEWKPVINIENTTIKIIHAPSNSQKKGTTYILDAIQKLKAEGYDINFFLAQNLSNHELKKHLEEADLIIDQLMIGWYGKLSTESMSLGKPVICWIDETLKNSVQELPIIIANPNNIYKKLKYILDNKETLLEIGIQSRDFVFKNHNYLHICKHIIGLFEEMK